jgi:colanic acid biosynthesis glycosyl transferase WcaI
MRIIFLTQYFPPEVGAPQVRLSELAHQFVRRGHEVTVLTGMPNYPTGKIYPGFAGALRRENEDGIRIIRTWLYPTQKADLRRRLANYFSFMLSSAFFGTFLLPRAQYLLVESPPLFLGVAGWWLSRLRRARMVFNVSDLWPESAVHVGAISRDSRAFRLAASLEGFLYRRAWLVSGQSKTIVGDVAARFSDVRTYHLSNGCDTQRFRPDRASSEVRNQLAPNDEFTVLYAGLHGLAQGLEQVIEAAKILSGERSCRFVLVGDGPTKASLQEEAGRLGLTNVAFLDPVPSGQMPGLVASADVAIITLKTYIPGAVPSKLYEAMASARPVIYVAEGEGAEVVRESDAGLVVQTGDAQGIADAVRALMDAPEERARLGLNGRRAAEGRFDRATIANRFIDLLENGTAN